MSLTAALLAVACGLTCACAMGTMRCAGTRAVERVCLVQDLYYDTQERKFTYHGTAIVNDTQDGIMSPATAATFASATCDPLRACTRAGPTPAMPQAAPAREPSRAPRPSARGPSRTCKASPRKVCDAPEAQIRGTRSSAIAEPCMRARAGGPGFAVAVRA